MIRKPSVESAVLFAICVADLLSTIFLVSGHGFVEGNPLMSYFLAQGVFAFVVAKVLLFVPSLLIAEWARQRRPEFVKNTLRTCICLYVLAYGVTFANVNGPSMTAMHAPTTAAPVSASMLGGR